MCRGRGCGCVRCVWCLCGACRGARCRFSLVPLVLPSPVLRCSVVPAVCRVPAVPPSLRASLTRLLATRCFVRGFVALFPFLCSPFSLARTCSLPPPWCAGYLPFRSWLRRSLTCPLPSVGSPSSLACMFSLPPPWCVSRSFPLPASLAPVLGPSSFSPVGSCETEGGLGRVGLLGNQATS